MDAAPTQLFDLAAPPRETLAALAQAGKWEAWRGALVMLAGMELDAAAELAGVPAGEFESRTVHDSYLDLVGLATTCERTGKWLVKWLAQNLECRDGDGNRLAPYLVRFPGDEGAWIAVYAQYKIGE